MDSTIERVKVLVLGNPGVGKSAAVHLICTGKPVTRALPSTIGCNVEVKLHDYKSGTDAQKSFFVELYEIGGRAGHAQARRVFYNSIHGKFPPEPPTLHLLYSALDGMERSEVLMTRSFLRQSLFQV